MINSASAIKIFYCYAPEDEPLCKEIEKHLANLQRQGLITQWRDYEINAGMEREQEINVHLDAAHIVLLMVSPDFMASKYCDNIARRAMELYERGKVHVIPVILRLVDWNGAPFSKLQSLPTDAKAVISTHWHSNDQAFLNIVEGIRKVIDKSFPQRDGGMTLTMHSDIGMFPPTDPKSVQQRNKAVEEVYEQLIQSDITALILTGIGGVGKSTIAALVCKYVEKQRLANYGPFTIEEVWIRVEPGFTITELAENLSGTLGVKLPYLTGLAPSRQAIALFNVLKSVNEARLIILDQFENLLDTQTGLVLPESAGISEWLDIINSQLCPCRVIFTSRRWPSGAHEYPPTYMQEYKVQGLDMDEGVELLRKLGVNASTADLKVVVGHCQGHTFSLILLASLLRRDRSLSIANLLDDPMSALLWRGDIAQNLLDRIFTQQLNRIQRKLLFSFSVYREPVPLEAAQALLEADTHIPKAKEKVQAACEVLVAQSLLQAWGNGLYQPHAIVADYARDHFNARNKKANQESLHLASAKAAHYYLQSAHVNSPPHEERRRVSDVHLFIEAVWHFCQAEQWQQAYDVIRHENLFVNLKRWGGNLTLLELYQLLLPLERWHPSRVDEAIIYGNLGDIYRTIGQLEQAQKYLEWNLRICEEERTRQGDGRVPQSLGRSYNWALNNLGRVHRIRNEMEQAQECFEQALLVAREMIDRGDEATTLNNLADIYYIQGRYEEARAYHEQSLILSREMADRGKEATSLRYLGEVYSMSGQREQAVQYYKEALNIQKEDGYRGEEAKTLSSLGTTYNIMGKRDEALKRYKEALEIFRAIGDLIGQRTALSYLLQIYDGSKQKDETLGLYKEALKLHRELGDQEREGTTLQDIGVFYLKQNNYDVALALFLLAIKIFEQTKSPEVNETRKKIEDLQKKIGKKRFTLLLSTVEPQAPQIVEQTLSIE